MKINIVAAILLILSVFGMGFFLVLPVISLLILFASTSAEPSVGIIGGADGPTATMITSTLYGNIFFSVGAVASVVVFVLSIVLLIKNNRKNQCEIKENSNE